MVDFVSVGDSTGGSNIVYTGHIYADKGSPKYLEISPDGSIVGIVFEDNGLNIYQSKMN